MRCSVCIKLHLSAEVGRSWLLSLIFTAATYNGKISVLLFNPK